MMHNQVPTVMTPHFEQRTGGGQGQYRAHPKPPSLDHIIRSMELSRARWFLAKIYTILCQSLHATDHPYLQRQKLYHQQRRGASVQDVEVSLD